MTNKEKTEYLAKKGIECPYCGSGELHCEQLDQTDNGIYQNVMCTECRREWTDLYTLTSVDAEE